MKAMISPKLDQKQRKGQKILSNYGKTRRRGLTQYRCHSMRQPKDRAFVCSIRMHPADANALAPTIAAPS